VVYIPKHRGIFALKTSKDPRYTPKQGRFTPYFPAFRGKAEQICSGLWRVREIPGNSPDFRPFSGVLAQELLLKYIYFRILKGKVDFKYMGEGWLVIIGPDFAVGHISRTGGDAMYAWFRALDLPGVHVDSMEDGKKHDSFRFRQSAGGKRLYIVMIRKLEEWAMSQMNAMYLTRFWKEHFKRREDAADPEKFLQLCVDWPASFIADAALLDMTKGVSVARWLRTEHLLEDVQSLAQDLGATKDSVAALADVETKPRCGTHPDIQPFSEEQRERLYANNPVWAAVETLVNR
jgi:hypothetical protein